MKRFFLNLSLLFIVSSSVAQWNMVYELVPPSPYNDEYFSKLCFLSADNAFFMTRWSGIHAAGYSIKNTNDGWNTVQSVFSEGGDYDEMYCRDMQFISDNIGYKLSGSGILAGAVKTIDGGRHWTTVANNASLYLSLKLFYLKEDFGYYLLDKDYLSPNFEVIASDSGRCTTYPVSDSYITPSEFIFSNDSTGYILCKDTTQNYLCLQSTDSAKTWTEVLNSASDKMQGMHFPSSQVGYILTQNGTIYRTADGGHNWNALPTNATQQLESVYFVNETLGYIAGMNGLLIKTINGGLSWTTETTGITENLKQVYFSDNGTGFIRTDSEKLYKYSNVGVENPEKPNEGNDCIGIYPNPVNDQLTISLCTTNQEVSARIVSMLGVEITQWGKLSSTNQLDISQLKSGVYLLQIEVGNKITNKRFLKG
ncbi:MAG: T9SS type A sorting domain-containing protein [Lentimicrobium sp.]|nr:T9SS type A sorting domain-containing protein [Lentimicrobium sp.]